MRIPLNETLLFCLSLLCLSSLTYAQQATPFFRPDEQGQLGVTIGLGGVNYLGDLNGRKAFRREEIGVTVEAGLVYRLADQLLARGIFRIVELRGSQMRTPQSASNLSFRSINPELMGQLQFDLRPAASRPLINPYLVAGVGFTYLSPQARYQKRWIQLAPLTTEGEHYSRLAVLATMGTGVSVRLPSQLLVSLEINYTLPSSDYLDDVSTVYPYASSLRGSEAIILSDRRAELGLPLHDPGDQRGFSVGKDAYLTGMIRLTKPLSSAKERKYRRDVNCVR
ncbi:hypothetical protein [Fibrella arboris]|uniref:hypothetical protein n=1 Tax=Fibrella arboris TaxID=3242486 RepID=UPI003521B8DE